MDRNELKNALERAIKFFLGIRLNQEQELCLVEPSRGKKRRPRNWVLKELGISASFQKCFGNTGSINLAQGKRM